MQQIEKKLEQIGLSDKESKMYLSALSLGKAQMSDLSKKSQMNRSTSYSVVNSLRDKGLLTIIIQKKRRFYVPADPEKLADILYRKNELLDEVLPILKGLSALPTQKPQISFFEGEDGLVKAFLQDLNSKGTILAMGGEQTFHEIIKHRVPDYVEQRKKKKIFLHMIALDTEIMQKEKENSQENFVHFKLISKEKFPLQAFMEIYDDSVAIISTEKLIAVIIESRDIANTLRIFFNLTWDLLP